MSEMASTLSLLLLLPCLRSNVHFFSFAFIIITVCIVRPDGYFFIFLPFFFLLQRRRRRRRRRRRSIHMQKTTRRVKLKIENRHTSSKTYAHLLTCTYKTFCATRLVSCSEYERERERERQKIKTKSFEIFQRLNGYF